VCLVPKWVRPIAGSSLGLSLDPEGLAINWAAGKAYIADEYGPSLVGGSGAGGGMPTRVASLPFRMCKCVLPAYSLSFVCYLLRGTFVAAACLPACLPAP
jgi:hypothetical protein